MSKPLKSTFTDAFVMTSLVACFGFIAGHAYADGWPATQDLGMRLVDSAIEELIELVSWVITLLPRPFA